MLYALKLSSTPYPVTVLVLPEVTSNARQQILALGSSIKEIGPLAYPFEVKFELGINKQCRYTKLNLWNLTEFDMIIYLDIDTVVKKVSRSFLFLKSCHKRLTQLYKEY